MKARETLRVMLMVQRRKRTQFTQKFKEHLEKVEGMIQEAIESLPDADIEGILKKEMPNTKKHIYRTRGCKRREGFEGG